MNPDPSHRDLQLSELRAQFHSGKIGRRTFTKALAALGIGAPAIGWMLRAYGVSASSRPAAPALPSLGQDDSNPITVTVGGTPIAISEEDVSNATPGGTLRFARAQDSKHLDPVTTDSNAEIWIFMNIYDQLLRVAQSGIALEPALAESYTISDDGLTYTFKLRQGVKFSDGSPFSADDVIYSLTRAANDPGQTWTFTLTALQRDSSGAVQGITAPDANTIQIVLAQPWAPFLSDLAMFNCSIVSKAAFDGKEDQIGDHPLGTGPFALGTWNKDQMLQLVKNTNYWEEGLPILDAVEANVVPDDNNRIIQIQGGQLDAIGDVPSARVPDLKSGGGLAVIEFPSTYTQYISLNTRNAPLNDVNARLALSYATDRQTLVDVVLFGTGIVATSFMPKGALYWDPNIAQIPYDVDKAKSYLAQSATPNGFDLTLNYLSGSAEFDQLGAVLTDMWSKIGVNLTLNPEEAGVFTDDYNNANFQAMINSWTNDIIDPDELVAYAILPESSQEFQTGWQNQEAIQLAKTAAGELDPKKRQADYYRIQELLAADSPLLYLYHKPYVVVTTPNVHNFEQPPTGQYVWKKTWVDA